MAGSISDISERKQVEGNLRASEARLSGILDIEPEAVIAIDAERNICLFNQGAERIFGYSSDEVIGKSLEMLMPGRFREGHKKHIEGFDRSQVTSRLMDQRQEIYGLKKDGTEFSASASVSKLEIKGDMIFTVLLQDITKRKEAEEALFAAKNASEQANRAKSEFLAVMSHELRTPLNAIGGFADMMIGEFFGALGSPKYKEYAEDIRASSDYLLNLVNDILDLSAIEAGKMPLEKESLSIKDMVSDCSRLIIKTVGLKDISYSVDAPAHLPSLHADKRSLKQILINVLSNAVKFTPNGGRISLSVKTLKGHHVFQVCDNGIGVAEEKLHTLTESFVRGETDPHKTQEGTGLGLAIVKSLIDLHDGNLTIESKIGKGTLVTISLPSDIR